MSGSWPAAADDMVQPPEAGLKSSHNYYLYNDGNPILGLVVTIELTKDVVCDDIGFHVQLNANSPVGSKTNWQQYVMGFDPDYKDNGKSEIIIGSSIEYFAKPHSFNVAKRSPIKDLPGPKTLPAGAKFIIAIKYAGNNVSGADFTYVEKDGKGQLKWTIAVPPPKQKPAVPQSVRTPIVAFQVDIVGKSSGDKAVMTSGEGTIIYTSPAPMTVVAKKPASNGDTAAETANSAYGELPIGPSKTFTQTFTVTPGASK